MATYKFSALPANKTFSQFQPDDSVDFNNDSIIAAQFVFSVNSTGDLVLSIASKTLTFQGLTLDDFTSKNFTFASASQFLIGDNNDNTLASSSYSSYIDGRGGNDTVTYDSVVDAVKVNLALDAPQNTLGGGMDMLVSIKNVRGSAFNDILIGDSTANMLDGGSGIDALSGGLGNDSYYVDNPLDQVIENTASGIDTIKSTVDYMLPVNVENLILLNNASNAIGNGSDNVMTGNAKANLLNGSVGADTLIGLSGDDIYIIDNSHDKADETSIGSGGNDSVVTTVSYTLSNNIENIKLVGIANLSATGNSGDNIIYANSGNNIVDGVTGRDTVSYQFGATRGVTIDLSILVAQNTVGSGSDTLVNIDNLIGSIFNDKLTGDVNANNIQGGFGNDVLLGGGGLDTLSGGYGDDTYVLSNTTGFSVIESGGQGTDTVQTSVTFNLSSTTAFANIENLTLTGANAINATGNAAANLLTGNSAVNILTGANGNDTLDGGLSADTLLGGAGNDFYVIDDNSDLIIENASEGTDTINASISYTIPDNVETLTLTGAANINGNGNEDSNTVTGNTGNNFLQGSSGSDKLFGGLGHDTLDGGLGIDILTGGDGDDVYYLDTASDSVVEVTKIVGGKAVQEGMDTIYSKVSYKITNVNVENLTLIGADSINGTGTDTNNVLIGNAANNTLTGAAGDDTISGGSGKDFLDGGKGADRMAGNQGDDVYIVDDKNDKVIESPLEGVDSVQASVSFTLAANVDALLLTSTANINGIGNADNNTLTGNTGTNVLSGLDGDDVLDGAAGTDTLTGGSGNDVFKFTAVSDTKVSAPDVITDFTVGADKLNFANLHTAALPLTLLTDKGASFTHNAGEIVFAASGPISENTTVSVDLNGDGNADFSVLLIGFANNLSTTDFIT